MSYDDVSLEKIKKALLHNKLVTPETISSALSFESSGKGYFDEYLIDKNLLLPQDLGCVLSEVFSTEYISLSQIERDEHLLKLLPVEFINNHAIYPYHVDENSHSIDVVTVNPFQYSKIDEVGLLCSFRPRVKLTTRYEMKKLLESNHPDKYTPFQALEDYKESQHNVIGLSSDEEIQKELEKLDSPVVKLVNSILAMAVSKNASDIHLESSQAFLLVRYRIDGILHDIQKVPKELENAVISRVKVMAGMDITEKRLPQDGRINYSMPHTSCDLRVNTLSVSHGSSSGESVVIRVLRSSTQLANLSNMGIDDKSLAKLMMMLSTPNGIILTTGPTGSGKTTTLYSCLQELNSKDKKIITIEDPVEYPLNGVSQSQISHKTGLSFAKSLRAILRQDPDIIMVGEIRDHETIDAAIHASLTGHLVLSTIHANSASKTFNRLRDMGAQPYLLSSSVTGIVAQRLVRKICESCKSEYSPDSQELQALHLDNVKDITLFKGAGCSDCDETGYCGRIGLFEVMPVTREIQELVNDNASFLKIQDLAIEQGMKTLSMDAERKISTGITTLSEVRRVLGANW